MVAEIRRRRSGAVDLDRISAAVVLGAELGDVLGARGLGLGLGRGLPAAGATAAAFQQRLAVVEAGGIVVVERVGARVAVEVAGARMRS